MQRYAAIVVMLALAGVIVSTYAADDARKPPVTYVENARLDRQIPELHLDGTPLAQAIDQLAQLTRANIVVDWPALEADHVVGPDTPICLRLYDVSLRKALELVLTVARPNELGFESGDDGIIRVSTRAALGRTAVLRMYDVRDLIEHGFVATDVTNAGEPYIPTRVERSDMLIALIMRTVDRSTWSDEGGDVGSIREMTGHLLITQTPANQQKIEYLLYNYRKAVAARKAGEKPTTRGIDLLAPPTTEPLKQ